MQISELIVELRKFPQDLRVVATWEGQDIEFDAKDIAEKEGELLINVDTWGRD